MNDFMAQFEQFEYILIFYSNLETLYQLLETDMWLIYYMSIWGVNAIFSGLFYNLEGQTIDG